MIDSSSIIINLNYSWLIYLYVSLAFSFYNQLIYLSISCAFDIISRHYYVHVFSKKNSPIYCIMHDSLGISYHVICLPFIVDNIITESFYYYQIFTLCLPVFVLSVNILYKYKCINSAKTDDNVKLDDIIIKL